MKGILTGTALLLMLVCMVGCTRKDPNASLAQEASIASFDDVKNREWQLVEVRTSSESVPIDRIKLEETGFNTAFTLQFDDEMISGVGAPNRFRGPYTLEDGNAITIGLLAGTMMAALVEPEGLREHAFLQYLQGVNRWNIVDGRLELYTQDEANTEVALVFVTIQA